jgi:hypothetical protein
MKIWYGKNKQIAVLQESTIPEQAPVAQLEEQSVLTRQVDGSIPSGGIKRSTWVLLLISVLGVGYIAYEKVKPRLAPKPAPAVVKPLIEPSKLQVVNQRDDKLWEKVEALDKLVHDQDAKATIAAVQQHDSLVEFSNHLRELSRPSSTVSSDKVRIEEIDAQIKALRAELIDYETKTTAWMKSQAVALQDVGQSSRDAANKDSLSRLTKFSDMVESWHKYYTEQQSRLTKRVDDLENWRKQYK